MKNDQLVFLRSKNIAGSIGAKNLIATTKYHYDKDTFEYHHSNSLFDGGDEAEKEGYYSFKSIKDYIESKGATELVKIIDGKLS